MDSSKSRSAALWREVSGLPLPIAGVDEVGRGSLVGDVVAAAVILDPAARLPGLNDSKRLTPESREACYRLIVDECCGFAIGRASAAEIDRFDILRATLLAMRRAVQALAPPPGFVFVDGNVCPDWGYRCEAVPQGDGCIRAIAAASIVAKVTRDREMAQLDGKFPGYGLVRNKGYPTPEHLAVLARLGPSPIHRRSFGPVQDSAVPR